MRHSAILDIGSSKIICMVVSSESDGAIIVHGVGSRYYNGYRFGVLPNERDLAEAIAGAVDKAERESRLRIKEACVGVPSPFILLYTQEGEAETLARNGRISEGDIDALLANSLDYPQPEGYSLMHSTPVAYRADGSPIKGSPIGLPAKWLSAVVSHCYVDNSFMDTVSGALHSVGILADSFISSILATAYFAIPEDKRIKSAILVDCGGSHTDIALLNGNAIVANDCIGIGGRHITSDICYGLRVPEPVAEDIKRRYVFSLDYGDSVERVRIPGEGVFAIEHSLIQLIIESRAEELCDLISDSISLMGADDRPVWLVGGGFALMRGAKEFLAKRLERDVFVTMPWMSAHSSVNYAAAFGLADFSLFRMPTGGGVLKRTSRHARRSFERHYK